MIWRPDAVVIADLISLFSKLQASFTNHRLFSEKIQGTRVKEIQVLHTSCDPIAMVTTPPICMPGQNNMAAVVGD